MDQKLKKSSLSLGAVLGAGLTSLALMSTPIYADHRDSDDDDKGSANSVKITFAHSGDFHGDYHPHTNGRGDAAGMLEGGIARAVTVLEDIRDDNDNVIHVHTGDTIHGSGEASITKGMALVRMVDQLGIDVSTPGNWEWAYTPYRYMQFFGVHDNDGNNLDIVDNDDFDTSVYKAVRYAKDSDYEEDNIGDVPTFGTPFRAVKYVSGFDDDGNPVMTTGYNRWGMVAANAYENGTWKLDHGVVSKGTGMNLTPPYRIIERDGVKIGFIGCTTNRGPQVVSSTITTGVSFSSCKGGIKFPQNRPIDWDDQQVSHGPKGGKGGAATAASQAVQDFTRDTAKEVADDPDRFNINGWKYLPHWGGNWGYRVKNEIEKWTNYLRDVEGVDLVAVMSEAGIAENIYAAENLNGMANGPDIYFSSDMHEETNFPVVVTDPNDKKVIIIENSEDIAQIGQLDVVVKNGAITSWSYQGHDVMENIAVNNDMQDLADQIDEEIADKIAAGDARNPYNNHKITYQLTDVVGETDDIILERNRFTNEHDPANKIMPGVIEGTGHALITDVFRKLAGADVGGLRGFRYTNSVLDGDDITYKSLYHFFPIGAQIAVGSIPTTPASEKALPTVEFYDIENLGCIPEDSNCNGVVFFDQADNKRHFVGFPRSLQQEMELGMNSSHNPNIPAWGGGWSWNYSGIKWNAQPTGPQFNKWGKKTSARISAIEFYDNTNGKADGEAISDAAKSKVKYASYYYHEDYNRINRNQLVTKGKCKKTTDPDTGLKYTGLSKKCVVQLGAIQILAKETNTGHYVMVDAHEYDAHVEGIAGSDGKLQVLDATEAMGRYIEDDDIKVFDWDGDEKGDLLRTVDGLDEEFDGDDFVYPRANLIMADGTDGNDMTDCTAEFGFPCIQPMRGAEAGLGIHTSLPGSYIKGTADTPSNSGDFKTADMPR